MKKRLLCAAVAAVILSLAVILSACGGTQDTVDIAALTDKMQAAADFPEMLRINSGDSREQKGFAAISDLDYEKVESFSLLYSADGSSYELAVIALKSENDASALESSLKKHIENRVQQYRYYDASQVDRAESAVVSVHGRYAALIMCGDNAAVREVFDGSFSR